MMAEFSSMMAEPAAATKDATGGLRHWWQNLKKRRPAGKSEPAKSAAAAGPRPHRTTAFFEWP